MKKMMTISLLSALGVSLCLSSVFAATVKLAITSPTGEMAQTHPSDTHTDSSNTLDQSVFQITPDSKFLAFQSNAINLDPGAYHPESNITYLFIKNLMTGTIARATENYGISGSSISSDGKYVTYSFPVGGLLYCKVINLETGSEDLAFDFGYNWGNSCQLANDGRSIYFRDQSGLYQYDVISKTTRLVKDISNLKVLSYGNNYPKYSLSLDDRYFVYVDQCGNLISNDLTTGAENAISLNQTCRIDARDQNYPVISLSNKVFFTSNVLTTDHSSRFYQYTFATKESAEVDSNAKIPNIACVDSINRKLVYYYYETVASPWNTGKMVVSSYDLNTGKVYQVLTVNFQDYTNFRTLAVACATANKLFVTASNVYDFDKHIISIGQTRLEGNQIYEIEDL